MADALPCFGLLTRAVDRCGGRRGAWQGCRSACSHDLPGVRARSTRWNARRRADRPCRRAPNRSERGAPPAPRDGGRARASSECAPSRHSTFRRGAAWAATAAVAGGYVTTGTTTPPSAGGGRCRPRRRPARSACARCRRTASSRSSATSTVSAIRAAIATTADGVMVVGGRGQSSDAPGQVGRNGPGRGEGQRACLRAPRVRRRVPSAGPRPRPPRRQRLHHAHQRSGEWAQRSMSTAVHVPDAGAVGCRLGHRRVHPVEEQAHSLIALDRIAIPDR